MNVEKELHTAQADEIEDIKIEDEMEQSYIDYAMSVIIGRSIPDVRDGLKPVQRRILYTMESQLGVTSSSSHVKSANVVGKTMGEYHPHGDSAIYDALARMAQDFSLRYPLIDGQGNFGSVDGDPPAAMRYTESRLAPMGEELLENIDDDTVDYSPNYDDRLQEPDVLPAKFPNILANGSSGIAVGLSTKIPSHNLNELVDATTYFIENPECSIDELMEHMPGPDFPMGGKIVGREGINNAYKTGRGRLTVQASYEIEHNDAGNDRITITGVPPEMKKQKMVEKTAELVRDEAIEGVRDIRDESNRDDGIQVVIELKKNAITEVVENQLVDKVIEETYGIINLAIVDGEPRLLSLKETLEEWLSHREEVIRRRSEDELEEREARAHILEGRKKALANVDDVVEIIQGSEDRGTAKDALTDAYDFSPKQADHIVRMQLGSLTSMESQEIEEEYEKIQSRIERLEEILNNKSELLDVIKEELQEVREEYGDERRTEIVNETASVSREDLIPEQDIFITLSNEGYLKRMTASSFKTQNRGGKGVIGTSLKQNDTTKDIIHASTHEDIFFLTSHGEVYDLKGYQLPEYGRNARGEPDVSIFDKLEDDEHITTMIPTGHANKDEDFLVLVTRNGLIKKTQLSEFKNILRTGIRAIGIDDDEVVKGMVASGEEDIVIGTNDGRAIRFSLSDVRSTGRSSRGVGAVELDDDQHVSGAFLTSRAEEYVESKNEKSMFTITENGYGKRSPLSAYRNQSRYGKGIIDIKTTERNGDSTDIVGVRPNEEIAVLTKDGNIIRMESDSISEVGRNTKGVKVVELDEKDNVASATVIR